MLETSGRCAVNGFPIQPMTWGVAADECQLSDKLLILLLGSVRARRPLIGGSGGGVACGACAFAAAVTVDARDVIVDGDLH